MSSCTDFLGNPVNVGDIIVYAVVNGRSAGVQQLGRIDEIIPLVERMTASGRTEWVRQDQQHKPSATTYLVGQFDYKTRTYKAQPDKMYVLRIRRATSGGDWSDKAQFLKNVDRIVVVTSLVSP